MNGRLFRVDDIARVVHEANRTMQIIHNDPAPSPPWDELDLDTQTICREGVMDVLAGAVEPEEVHEDWCTHLKRNGWVYGPTKSTAAKTHPCLLPYHGLPAHQRAKDAVFVAIVRAMGAAEPD